jgi:hypothetical protein
VAFFIGDAVEIRPLGPGQARRLDLGEPAEAAAEMTVFLGAH